MSLWGTVLLDSGDTMDLSIYRKAIAISYASQEIVSDDLEKMSLTLTRLSPRGDFSTVGEVISYIFKFGAWVRDNEQGFPILINGISKTIARLPRWENTWSRQLSYGKGILDAEALEALQWLDDCGGQMAQENLPGATTLIASKLAKEGPRDQFGRKTILAAYPLSDSLGPTNSVSDTLGWFYTMPDTDTETIRTHIEEVKKRVNNLTDCQAPVGYDTPFDADIIQCGILDCDGDVGSGHSGFVFCSARTYMDMRRFTHALDLEFRKEHLQASIFGRIHDAVIVVRSNIKDGYFVFADPEVKYTCTYYPACP